MNRRIVACAVALMGVLSATGCSGTSTGTPTTASTQSVADACVSLNEPLQDVVAVLQETTASTDTDPQAAVDAWTQLAVTFGQLSSSVGNADVKAAVEDTRRDVAALRDVLQNEVDGATTSEVQVASATAAMQESLSALATLCKG